jgi:hypothetical protein
MAVRSIRLHSSRTLPGPRLRREARQHVVVDGHHVAAELPREARREVPNQQWDVFPPLAQRRNAQIDDVEPIRPQNGASIVPSRSGAIW